MDVPNSEVDTSVSLEPSHEPVCVLRFLMINGEDFRLTVPAVATIRDVKLLVIEKQPQELIDFLKASTPSITTPPSKTDEIRILHFGKFLDDMKSLKECNFAIGKDDLTVVHISVRIPCNQSEDVKEKLNKKSNSCCVIM